MTTPKHLIPFIFISLLVPTAICRASPMTDAIFSAASKNANALQNAEYAAIADMTYPKLVTLLGGREKLIEMLERGMEDPDNKTTIESVSVGAPSEPISAPGKMFSIVPMTMVQRIPARKIKFTNSSYLLAISEDEGQSWTFLDGSGLNPKSLGMILPDFPASLKLPEKVPPKIEPE